MGMTLDPGTERDLERFFGDWLTDADVPGASLAIIADDEVAYTGGFGSRELATNRPATPETLYGVASCTKSFVGLSILLLDERGALSTDDPVTDHLDRRIFDEADELITLHDLLTHSSGIPSLGTSTVLLERLTDIAEHGIPLGDREDFYRHLDGARDELVDTDEERFMYCNAGYNLLGAVVSAVSGQPFDAFVETEILDPLGMERSTFDPAVLETGNAMTPYALRDGDPEATQFPHRLVSYPAGGLIASVTELTRYLRLQTGGGSFDGVDLVPAATLERAHTGHVDRADGAYGYGWNRSAFRGRTLVGHGGSLGVSSSYLGFTGDGEYAIAIGANTTPSPAPPTVAKGVLAILDGEDPHAVVPHFARAERFAALTGTYDSYRGITTATVERHAGVLRLTVERALGDESMVLLPTDPERPDDEFEIPTMAATGETATFEDHNDHIDLYYDRNRLHKRL